MFNKTQRLQLSALSQKVYGTETGWVKLLNDPKYQIVVGQKETDDQKYVQYQTKDGRPGTVVSLEKAIEKYGFKATEEQLNKKVIVTENRSATFDELMSAMQAAFEIGVHSQLYPEERQHVFAYMFFTGKLAYKLSLELGDGEQTKKSFYEQLSLLSEDLQNSIKEMLNTADRPVKGVPIDAYGFVSDIVFCKSHTEKAAELMHSYLADATARVSAPRKMVSRELQVRLQKDQLNKTKRKLNQKKKEGERNAAKKKKGRGSPKHSDTAEKHQSSNEG